MKIIDDKKLIPDAQKDTLIRIVKNHPSGKNLFDSINDLTIELSTGNSEAIDFDISTRDATLYIFEQTATEDDFECTIHHEFFHVADRLSVRFKYSDEKKDLLTEDEKRCVWELWNLYVDTRLNDKGLLKIRRGSSALRIDGKLQIIRHRTIAIKLMESTNFLKQRGVSGAENIVRKIWERPSSHLSYEDMINIVKNGRKSEQSGEGELHLNQ